MSGTKKIAIVIFAYLTVGYMVCGFMVQQHFSECGKIMRESDFDAAATAIMWAPEITGFLLESVVDWRKFNPDLCKESSQ